MTGSKRGADEFEPQGPITRRTRRTLVESDDEEEDAEVSSSQASTGDLALRCAGRAGLVSPIPGVKQ